MGRVKLIGFLNQRWTCKAHVRAGRASARVHVQKRRRSSKAAASCLQRWALSSGRADMSVWVYLSSCGDTTWTASNEPEPSTVRDPEMLSPIHILNIAAWDVATDRPVRVCQTHNSMMQAYQSTTPTACTHIHMPIYICVCLHMLYTHARTNNKGHFKKRARSFFAL